MLNTLSKKDSQIILIVAIVLLLGFAAAGMMQTEKKPSSNPAVTHRSDQAGASASSLMERSEVFFNYSAPVVKPWLEPKPQSDDGKWAYDVFTPPRIYINPETGDFEPEAFQFQSDEDVAPELQLLRAVRPEYRFQLVGFIENDLNNASRSILLIEDIETDEMLRLRFEAGTKIAGDVEMNSFQILVKTSESGAIQRIAVLNVTTANGNSLDLKSNLRTLAGGYTLNMKYGEIEFVLSESQPHFAADNFKVEWHSHANIFPEFKFSIHHSETGVSEELILKSYLSHP